MLLSVVSPLIVKYRIYTFLKHLLSRVPVFESAFIEVATEINLLYTVVYLLAQLRQRSIRKLLLPFFERAFSLKLVIKVVSGLQNFDLLFVFSRDGSKILRRISVFSVVAGSVLGLCF